MPNEYTWICSQHFITEEKNYNLLAPNYIPSLFEHVDSPVKRRLEGDMDKFHRRPAMKRRRTVEEISVLVCSVPAREGNEIPDTNCSTLVVGDNEETNSSNGETQIFTDKNEENLLPICSEQEATQDAEIEDDFEQEEISYLKQQNSYLTLNICYLEQQSILQKQQTNLHTQNPNC